MRDPLARMWPRATRTLTRAGCLVALAVLVSCSNPAGGGAAAYTAPPATVPPTGAAPWPAPEDALALARTAGLTPATHEFFTYHVHAHLDVFVNGTPMPVPAAIGIDISDPAVQHGQTPYGMGYGGITECAEPCISPLHTHQADGVIHTEAPDQKSFTLGQFFAEWGVRLDATCVGGYCAPAEAIAVFVNGERSTGDPAAIVLSNLEEIAIVIGSPPATIPGTFPATPSPIPTASG